MNKKIKSKYFTAKEVTDFRRLSKVYNFKSINVEKDLFNNSEENVTGLYINFKYITGSDERALGNIARITKSVRVSVPNNGKITVTFTKKI